jgi:starch phosphorylase
MEQVTVPTLAGQEFALPPALEGLRDLAYNLWWSWTPRASSFFSRIEAPVWSRYRNPVPVLAACDAARWEALMADEDFVVDAMRLLDEFHAYMADPQESWIAKSGAATLEGPIAYFCAEFGLHESMQIYSGGLGVLAGDHCKSASDAGLPFIGVGLLYRRGYFRQQIDADGHQEHAQPDLDPRLLPLRRAMAAADRRWR